MKTTLIILMLLTFKVYAKKALYEFGLAGGTGLISDYPGSDERRLRTVFVPTFIYRGAIFKNDQRGTRALFYHSRAIDIDLSVGAALPADSSKNKARENMDDLDWLGEIGPRVNIDLYKKGPYLIEAELPLRYVFSTDFSFTQYRGLRLYPQIDIRRQLNSKLRLNISFKMNWATEEFNDYFYEVPIKDVTSNRARFNAKSGYVGQDITVFLTYRHEKTFYILGARHSNFKNSTNRASPLFRTDSDTAIYMAFNYFYFQSKKKAH